MSISAISDTDLEQKKFFLPIFYLLYFFFWKGSFFFVREKEFFHLESIFSPFILLTFRSSKFFLVFLRSLLIVISIISIIRLILIT